MIASLLELQAAYHEGRHTEVLKRYESLRQQSVQPVAELRQLAAQAYVRQGNLSQAVVEFLFAARAHAASRSSSASVCARNAFGALQRMGAQATAEWAGLYSLTLPQGCDADVSVLQQLFSSAQTARDTTAIGVLLSAASRFSSTRATSLETLIDIARDSGKYGLIIGDAAPVTSDVPPPKVSVIVCSRDDSRFARFSGECVRAFANSSYDIIRISDAKSMCEGYNRGLAKATGDLLVFCHDDIEFLSDRVDQALAAALSRADVLSCVGATALAGPMWFSGDVLHLQGWMAAPGDRGYVVGIAGVPDPCENLSTGDGCFIACRADVARALQWDDTTFDSFHLYDMDFCARARQGGYRLAVSRDIAINHHSYGNYDQTWQRYAARFLAKHAMLPAPVPRNQWVSVSAESRANAARILRNLAALVPLNWRAQLDARLASRQEKATQEFPPLARFLSAEQG